MKRFFRSALVGFFFIGILVSTARAETIQATLIGYEEVPSVSTVAHGEFRGFISRNNDSIDYELTYDGLQGNVTQAHIHFGQRSVNGGIVLWFCGTMTNPGPAGTPLCTNDSGHFTGTFTSGNVQGIGGGNVGQQLSAGELAEVIRAIRAGSAYVNVHTTLSAGGEIRGQISAAAKK